MCGEYIYRRLLSSGCYSVYLLDGSLIVSNQEKLHYTEL